eukprot:NODE_971_length_1645_cov_53.157895_g801_i0.p1 GENE.NODE_971_length_1645_cov_53.157895_g801_i0~~NODE_971_length_1645_cov_53.157895_g801_i0.p1  ORF type:complete len:471 (-),score=112.50 NODE_971_length_1645_cov_53.157895_g801_i0:101-1513(-)
MATAAAGPGAGTTGFFLGIQAVQGTEALLAQLARSQPSAQDAADVFGAASVFAHLPGLARGAAVEALKSAIEQKIEDIKAQLIKRHPQAYQVPRTSVTLTAEYALKNEVWSAAVAALKEEFTHKQVHAMLDELNIAQQAQDLDLPALQYNEIEDWDPDHWFNVPVLNANLFHNLTLRGVPELLPGKLFSTRMPRELNQKPQERADFAAKVRKHNLHTVLVLTEAEEYKKYAGTDLEAFYKDLGLQIITRPIVDFTVPNNHEMVANIRDATELLSAGKNVLVHCAGGSGRTGMVIAGVLRNCGISDPIVWARQVKTSYVETYAQERFVHELPLVFDDHLAQQNPQFFQAVVAEQLLDHFLDDTDPTSLPVPDGILDDATRADYRAVFNLFDKDKSGVISIPECAEIFRTLGAHPDVLAQVCANGTDTGKRNRRKNSPLANLHFPAFLRIMCAPPKYHVTHLFSPDDKGPHH